MKIKEANLSCAICQPHYLPWIGYLEMIDRVDVFVFLDDVQFVKREWKNRNKIRKTADGEDTKWLTVPIVKQSQKSLIKDAMISNESDWVHQHLQSIQRVYANTPYFKEYYTPVKNLIECHREDTLANLNIALITYLCKELEVNTKLIRSSDLKVNGKKEVKLLNVCKALGSDLYLANNATGEYVEENYFKKDGIWFELQNYRHPVYNQINKNKVLSFISHLSVIDIIYSHGSNSMEIIRTGKHPYN